MNAETEILQRLARIEEKLDNSRTRTDDHEKRLRRLEWLVWVAVGAAAAGGGLVARAVGSLIGAA